MSLDSPFQLMPCLANVDAQLISVNRKLIDENNLEGLNLFLSPSNEINGCIEKLRPALLRHMHHRSSEIPHHSIRRDNRGGVYSVRRLKGNGLYSGPRKAWRHKIRNIKKDPTGYVLGLQVQKEYQEALSNSMLLRDMGIETEIPEGALLLREVIYKIRHDVYRLSIEDAIAHAGLPLEYKNIPFVIRVDSLGINHRLKDYIYANPLLSNSNNTSLIRSTMLSEAVQFINEESRLINSEIPFDIAENISSYLKFIIDRIMRNVALLHKNQGIHGQLTAQNLTLDGKFIDYDTLQWKAKGDEFEKERLADISKLNSSLSSFIYAVCKEHNLPLNKKKHILKESDLIYHYNYL